MILVLSFDYYEQGTDPVIDWLLYHKADFVKVTIQDLIQTNIRFNIDINKGRIFVEGKDITDEIKVIWYRRFEEDLVSELPNSEHSEQALFELKNEVEVTVSYLKRILANKKWMPYNEGISLDKPEVTYFAEQFNLKTPKSIITNNKKDLLDFQANVKTNLISKPIRHSSYFIDNQHTYSIYTQKFEKPEIETLPENFVLTLFQECVDSEFEIRVFYLDGEFYATAIIVSDKPDNVVDVKLNYNSNNISWVPYKLPEEYEQSLDAFMKSINLNTGSLDIMKTKDNEYVMLEVNPVGQYSAPGYRCNYNLEEKIANWLISYDN
ncbi:hypothetical protein [Tenacibaculum sp. 190524A02b]|uniref:hypothetical protein n=1 Tax=Tenacibaculum vairaonense TaxID=3137860 RepID=UPI0031FA5278